MNKKKLPPGLTPAYRAEPKPVAFDGPPCHGGVDDDRCGGRSWLVRSWQLWECTSCGRIIKAPRRAA